MAVAPYFVISPNTIVSLVGLLKGPDKTVPSPQVGIEDITVDVVIPTFNEEKNVVLALACLYKQTKKPRKIYMIDDGSSDGTVNHASKFAEANSHDVENPVDIEIIQRKESIGKTPSLKRQARESDCDVLFILDGDTLIETDTYLERVCHELFFTPARGVASVCGTVLPLWKSFRRKVYDYPSVQRFFLQFPEEKFELNGGAGTNFLRNITNIYRSALYMYLEKFIYRGQMRVFGTVINPVGCAVGYRREYLEELFDEYEEQLGDDLTNSEDIFIGMAMDDKGYRNVQIEDVYAKTEEPPIHRLPFQCYKWSSAYLQSCYYFLSLLISPIRVVRRHRNRKKNDENEDLRMIKEPYRQPFGRKFTSKMGRPIGWSILSALIEKLFFPLAFVIMILFQWWEAIIVTLIAEIALSLLVLIIIAKGERVKYFLMGLVSTPIRYFVMFFDIFTIGRFAVDVVLLRDRRWRK
jgi:glycosyltransferase involved in cell wall biosynthesis